MTFAKALEKLKKIGELVVGMSDDLKAASETPEPQPTPAPEPDPAPDEPAPEPPSPTPGLPTNDEEPPQAPPDAIWVFLDGHIPPFREFSFKGEYKTEDHVRNAIMDGYGGINYDGPHDLKNYDSLEFDIRSLEGARASGIAVGLSRDHQNMAEYPMDSALGAEEIGPGWRHISIPLEGVTFPDGTTNYDSLIFWNMTNNNGVHLSVRDIYYVPSGAFHEEPAPEPSPAPAPEPEDPPTEGPTGNVFKAKDGRLYAPDGQEVVMRGVNKMFVWTDQGGAAMPEIAQTKSNTVRIVWDMGGHPDRLEHLMERCLSHGMLPVPELHDATGRWWQLDGLVDWWANNARTLIEYNDRSVVNIGNEVGNWDVSSGDFRRDYIRAVQRMRRAGYRMPLMIDGTGWGQNLDILLENAREIEASDPDHNIIFSVHAWWTGIGDQEMRARIRRMRDSGHAFCIGEFAHTGVGCNGHIPYKVLLEECQRHRIGWLAWSWGPGNSDCREMDMTHNNRFDGLQGWGRETALTDANSIANTSEQVRWLSK